MPSSGGGTYTGPWSPYGGGSPTLSIGPTAQNVIYEAAITDWPAGASSVEATYLVFDVLTADATSGVYYDIGICGPAAPGGTCTLDGDLGSGTQGTTWSAGIPSATAFTQGQIVLPTPPAGEYYYYVYTSNGVSPLGKFSIVENVIDPVCSKASTTTSANGQLPASIAIVAQDWTDCSSLPNVTFHN